MKTSNIGSPLMFSRKEQTKAPTTSSSHTGTTTKGILSRLYKNLTSSILISTPVGPMKTQNVPDVKKPDQLFALRGTVSQPKQQPPSNIMAGTPSPKPLSGAPKPPGGNVPPPIMSGALGGGGGGGAKPPVQGPLPTPGGNVPPPIMSGALGGGAGGNAPPPIMSGALGGGGGGGAKPPVQGPLPTPGMIPGVPRSSRVECTNNKCKLTTAPSSAIQGVIRMTVPVDKANHPLLSQIKEVSFIPGTAAATLGVPIKKTRHVIVRRLKNGTRVVIKRLKDGRVVRMPGTIIKQTLPNGQVIEVRKLPDGRTIPVKPVPKAAFAQPIGPGRIFGPKQPIGPGRIFGSKQPIGPGRIFGPKQPIGPGRIFGSKQPIGPGRIFGSKQPIGPGRIFGPKQPVPPPPVSGPKQPVPPPLAVSSTEKPKPVDCKGEWSECSKKCGGGNQYYKVLQPSKFDGKKCEAFNGKKRSCNTQSCGTPCEGSWNTKCSKPCGGGILTYTVTKPATGLGAPCSNKTGDTKPCNTDKCAVSLKVPGYRYLEVNELPSTFTLTSGENKGLYVFNQDPFMVEHGSINPGVDKILALQPYKSSDVYNKTKSGMWYTLSTPGSRGNPKRFLRHSNYVLYTQDYSPNNYDFAWALYLKNGTNNKVILYNPFPGDDKGYWVSEFYNNGKFPKIGTQDPSNAHVFTISPSI